MSYRVAFAVALLASLAPSPAAARAGDTPAALVRVDLGRSSLTPEDLLASDLDLVAAVPGTDTWELVAGPLDRERLDALGVAYEVVHEDLLAFYAERLARDAFRARGARAPRFGAWLSPPFAQGAMNGYYTWAEMASVLDQIAAAYPTLVTPKFSLGVSHEGRELWSVKLSDNPGVDEAEPEVRIDALHHAREPGGMHTALWALLYLVESYGTDPLATWIVDHREVWFVPCVNPDGYEYNRQIAPGGGGLWRKNRRNNGTNFGVDLNRNYPFGWGWDNVGSSPSTGAETYRGPSAASEPEVQAMVSFLAARSFETAVTCHTYSNLWLANWGYIGTNPPDKAAMDELGMLATFVNGYPFGSCFSLLYPINGGTQDTDYGVHGTFSWLPEIGSNADGFWPPTSRIVPLAEENRLGLARTMLAAGAWVRVESSTLVELGDGDGDFEPGESFELRFHLRNSGRHGTTGPVLLSLASTSPGVTLVSAALDLGPLAAFTSVDNDATPLVFAIDPLATPGDVADVLAAVRWEGFEETRRTIRPIGTARPYLADSLELELGWLAGLPGDTATSGRWEYGAPLGTTSAGRPANPGQDASPDGTRCYATGNGATSASGDDVDDGATTLISPRIDLAAARSAVVSFQRWFADFTNADDLLEVAVSNDDGASWVPVEALATTANAWTESSFVLNAFVPPSDAVRLRFVIADEPDNSILEAGVDDLAVEVFEAGPFLNLYGRPVVGAQVAAFVLAEPGDAWFLYWSPGTASLTVGALNGTILIDPTAAVLAASSLIPAAGTARAVLTSPNDPNLVGQTIYFQALTASAAALTLTNRDQLTFE